MISAVARTLVGFFESKRWPLSDEKRLQQIISEEFVAAGIVAEWEVNLGDGDIIDFRVGYIGVEVKVKGVKRAIFRQCECYCAHDGISELILATNVALGMPPTINGKPVGIAMLGKGWL